jgi:hypothetical protein
MISNSANAEPHQRCRFRNSLHPQHTPGLFSVSLKDLVQLTPLGANWAQQLEEMEQPRP